MKIMAEKATCCKCYYLTYSISEMRFQTIPARAAKAIQTGTPSNAMVWLYSYCDYTKILAILFLLKSQGE